jgi:uncharacterized protein (DUF849 family)
MQKVILEARVNEFAMRTKNPNVPWTPAEIATAAAECEQAGATVVHFHARQADGAPDHRFETYEETVTRIREQTHMLVHPSLGYVTLDASAEERLQNVLRLAQDSQTKPDFVPMDMGSVNVDWYDPTHLCYDTKELIYKNSTATLEYFAKNITSAGMRQYLAVWNISFTRQALAFMDMGLIPEPAYLCFVLTDGVLLAGHPGTPEGLDAHLAFLPEDKNIHWSVCNYNGDLLRLTEKIILAGGHISIGLGDYAYTQLGTPTNADLIARVAEQAKFLGRDVATLDETRGILGIH